MSPEQAVTTPVERLAVLVVELQAKLESFIKQQDRLERSIDKLAATVDRCQANCAHHREEISRKIETLQGQSATIIAKAHQDDLDATTRPHKHIYFATVILSVIGLIEVAVVWYFAIHR